MVVDVGVTLAVTGRRHLRAAPYTWRPTERPGRQPGQAVAWRIYAAVTVLDALHDLCLNQATNSDNSGDHFRQGSVPW